MSDNWTGLYYQKQHSGQTSSNNYHGSTFQSNSNSNYPMSYSYERQTQQSGWQGNNDQTSKPFFTGEYSSYQQRSETSSLPTKHKDGGKYSDVWNRIDSDPHSHNDQVAKKARYERQDEQKFDRNLRSNGREEVKDNQDLRYGGRDEVRSDIYPRGYNEREYRDRPSPKYDNHAGFNRYDERDSRRKNFEKEEFKTTKSTYRSAGNQYKDDSIKAGASKFNDKERYHNDNHSKIEEEKPRNETSKSEKGASINVDRLNDALKLAESLKGLPSDTQNAVWKAVFSGSD